MAAAKRDRAVGDGETPDPKPDPNAPTRPNEPRDGVEHSPLIPWGTDAQSTSPKPYKNLK